MRYDGNSQLNINLNIPYVEWDSLKQPFWPNTPEEMCIIVPLRSENAWSYLLSKTWKWKNQVLYMGFPLVRYPERNMKVHFQRSLRPAQTANSFKLGQETSLLNNITKADPMEHKNNKTIRFEVKKSTAEILDGQNLLCPLPECVNCGKGYRREVISKQLMEQHALDLPKDS